MLDKEIFEYKDFGCIKICLDGLMNSKNISTYELSTKSGIRFQTIQSLRKEESTRINFDVLSKLCYMLDCNIEDIIKYIPSKHE